MRTPLQQKLKELGFTQRQFAKYIGYSEQQVSGWANGTHALPLVVHRLIKFLEKSSEYLRNEE